MGAKPRKGLEEWQKQDAKRLKAIWDAADRKVRGSQESFGAAHGLGSTQGLVWQYLNGKIPLNLKAAIKFAKGLGCEVSAFSERLAAELVHDLPTQSKDPEYILESTAIKMLRTALPEWRTYVLNLACIESISTQQVMLDAMRRPTTDRRVEQSVTVAPHAAARKSRERQ